MLCVYGGFGYWLVGFEFVGVWLVYWFWFDLFGGLMLLLRLIYGWVCFLPGLGFAFVVDFLCGCCLGLMSRWG